MDFKKKIALLLIDIQKGMEDTAYWGKRNNPEAEINAARLLTHFRTRNLPVFHVKHNSANPASPLAIGKAGNALSGLVRPVPGETLIEKSVNSAFIGTELLEMLEARSIGILCVAGLTTDHCVSTTVRMAANLGYLVYLASDATATFERTGLDGRIFDADQMHAMELASLQGEFAEVHSTEKLISFIR